MSSLWGGGQLRCGLRRFALLQHASRTPPAATLAHNRPAAFFHTAADPSRRRRDNADAQVCAAPYATPHAPLLACPPSRTGIPKFYRWLSERYPLLNMSVAATEAPPEMDNLYLDMNGIIHNCTHANDPNLKLTETEMVVRIFTYLDKLIQIIKPQKLVFMAIDGGGGAWGGGRPGGRGGARRWAPAKRG